MKQREFYDVVVIGGGPGGSTVAGLLAQKGTRVLLLEKEHFPRFHLGESLLPMSLEVFDELGVTRELDGCLLRKHGARFVHGDTGEEVSFKFADAVREGHPHAFQGPRGEIDHVLLRHAARLGVDVREAWTVESYRTARDGSAVIAVGPAGERAEIDARVVIDATGRDALSGRKPGAKIKIPRLERTLAVFSHYDGCQRMSGLDEGDIRIVIVKEGWFWIIPFRGNRTSVGVVLGPSFVGLASAGLDAALDSVIEAYPAMRAVMHGATRVFPTRAAADFSYRREDITGDGFLALGDAAGFIDPLFSTGFHLAVKGASIAAATIDDALRRGDVAKQRFDGYARMVKRARDTYVGLVQAFYEGSLVDLLFETKKRDMMRKLVTSVLAGDVFHDEEPRWLREIQRRFPPFLGSSTESSSSSSPENAEAMLEESPRA